MMSSTRCSLQCRGLRAEPRCLDIGSGIPTTIHELAHEIAAICDAPEPIVVPKFRDGDVRAASCDIEPAKTELGWHPKWTLEDGLHALLEWIGGSRMLSSTNDHTPVPGRPVGRDGCH